MKACPNLQNLLQYKNPLVVQRFAINYPDQAAQAESLFVDMLQYLWLCRKLEVELAQRPDAPELQFLPVMHEEMRNMDHIWHEFILITPQYHAFCDEFFGGYVHHVPNMREELDMSADEFARQLELFLSFVYDQLGETTLRRWFEGHLTPVETND